MVTLYMEISVFGTKKKIKKGEIGTLTSVPPWKYVLVWYIILLRIIYQEDTSLIFQKNNEMLRWQLECSSPVSSIYELGEMK